MKTKKCIINFDLRFVLFLFYNCHTKMSWFYWKSFFSSSVLYEYSRTNTTVLAKFIVGMLSVDTLWAELVHQLINVERKLIERFQVLTYWFRRLIFGRSINRIFILNTRVKLCLTLLRFESEKSKFQMSIEL